LVFSISQNDETLDEAMRIDQLGNVGIGTTSPSEKLHISGGKVLLDYVTYPQLTIDSAQNAAIYLDAGSDSYTNQFRFLRGGVAKWRFGQTNQDGGNEDLYYIYYDGTWHNVLVLNYGTGNVGIGVTDPDTKLEVFGSTGLKISFDATDNTTLVTDTAGNMTISPSGTNVGVAGDIKAIGSGATGLILYDTTLAGYYRVTLDNGSLVITAI